jgi:predicted secreted hydrolase
MRCRGRAACVVALGVVALATANGTADPSPRPSPLAGEKVTGTPTPPTPIATSTSAPTPPSFLPAAPGYAWSFPRDHWKHDGYRNEWWYFTGQLSSAGTPARRFGYQLTFFRVGLLPRRPDLASPWTTANLVMVHAAISDLDGGSHVFSEVLWREMPYLGAFAPYPEHPIAWARAPAGTAGRWTLDLDGEVWRMEVEDRTTGLAFRLAARPERPLVFQGPGGLSRKAQAEGYASLYYSFTRLATEGTLTVNGGTHAVRGTSWMDREIGSSQLATSQVGWDWFGLRLADGRDLTLYVLRRADGSIDFARGTLVERGGAVRWLRGDELTVRATGRWTSPASGATYPAGWRVEVPGAGLALDVAPSLADQENRDALAGGVVYWEGAVRVRDPAGTDAGEGYVELTGYGKDTRPPI